MIAKTVRWIWDSPTFTTWGNYSAQSLRLFVVVPLILTRFNEQEVASWFLFASLSVFGTTITQRMGVTFSRMISLSMGGAKSLAPIKDRSEIDRVEGPNWSLLQRAYSTIGSINIVVGGVSFLAAIFMGYFGFKNILNGYDGKAEVWIAFFVMQIGSVLRICFQKYNVALRGMNYVALANRWGVLTSLFSSFLGCVVLLSGGGIIILATVMQVTNCTVLAINKYLLKRVEGGKVSNFRPCKFDGEVLKWAWVPTWRGMIIYLADYGIIQIGTIVFTYFGSVSEVASLLFTLQLVRGLVGPCGAPLYSIMPRMGRLLAEGKQSELTKLYFKRVFCSQIVLFSVIAGLFVCGGWAMKLLNAETKLIGGDLQLLLFGMVLHQWFVAFTGTITTLSNNIVLVGRCVVSFAVGLSLMYPLISEFSTLGFILAVWAPRVLILNVNYCRYSIKVLTCSLNEFVVKIYAGIFVSSIFLIVMYFVIY